MFILSIYIKVFVKAYILHLYLMSAALLACKEGVLLLCIVKSLSDNL